MSFSGDVKEELSRQHSGARHCQLAEIAAMISFCGRVFQEEGGRYGVRISTENVVFARKCFTLIKKTFNINTVISVRRNPYLKKARNYVISVSSHQEAEQMLQALKLLEGSDGTLREEALADRMVIQSACCKRAFLRGAFLASGSISDPEKFYHFEVVCISMAQAEQLQELMGHFGIEARIVERKKHFVAYIKEGSQIVDILNVMEAPVALMRLENIRIMKEMRNAVNRKVNCETANINKTVNASVKQIDDIRLIEEKMGFEKLPEGLKEIALLRINYPDSTLKELGELLSPPVGKSGVNHRLRKLTDIAKELRS